MTIDQRAHWEERYACGPTPWDTGITPPEVVAFWERDRRLPPTGLALDLGCGTATNVCYLARRGLQVIGFDLSLRALVRGREKVAAQVPDSANRVQLVQSDVSRLPLTGAGAVYALDIGCFHGLSILARYDYAKRIAANLRAGGYYHLFAFDRDPDDEDLRGLLDDEVQRLFVPAFKVISIERGIPDRRPCRWYLLRRR